MVVNPIGSRPVTGLATDALLLNLERVALGTLAGIDVDGVATRGSLRPFPA